MRATAEFETAPSVLATGPDQASPIPGQARGRIVGVVTILTLAVAVLGYIRESALAARFGLTAIMDAYFGAIFIPTNIYLILVVGTVSPIFIPILLHDIDSDSVRASESFSVVVNFVLLLVAAVVAMCMATAHLWITWLFPGFDSATRAMSLRLIYMIFPAVPLLAVSGVLTAALNGYHKYSLAAFAPALSSIAVIVAAMFARGAGAIYIVGVGTALGFLLQCLVLVPAVGSLGIRYRPVFNFRHRAIGRLFQLGGPLALYLIIANVSLVIERNLASRLSAGALSSLTYAMRLFTVPSNFLAAPLVVVAYPYFAREALRPGYGDLREDLTRVMRFVVFLFAPVTVWLVLNALPITRLLYERGNFGSSDSHLVATVLKFYSVGILPNAITVLVLRCLYAIEDTVTPLVAESIDLAYFVICAPVLTNRFGIWGLAMARGLTFVLVGTILVGVLWRRRRLLKVDQDLLGFVWRAMIATAGMTGCSWFLARLLQPSFERGGTLWRAELVGVQLIVSAAVFLVAASLLKMQEAHKLLRTAMTLHR
jgi:putative peptidoglycan lipid II flippase